MNFLVWYNPLTWLGDMAETIFGAIIAGLNILLYFLSTFVYGLIIDLYNLFDILSKSRILDADIIETLANRIGLVLGVVMLFMVIISAIQMILDPDKIEKEAGNIIKKVLLVIVMLGASSFAFRALYGVQNILLESNVVSKLLLPYNVDTENFGGVLSSELFGAFYYVNNDLYTIDEADNIIADGDVVECYNNTKDLKEGIRDNKEFGAGYQCLNATSEDLNIIKFNGLLLLIFGLVAAYFLLSYCISVGVRTIQLAFLEIISPMAIISYLSPKKDTMFEKWWKLYFSTYIDVFIRVILINFIVFLIATIFENDGGWAFWKTVEENGGASGDFFIKVMMIMALLTFAQKAPNLITKLLPGSDSGIGFGINNQFGAAGLGLGIGAVGGAIGGAVAGKGLGKLTGAATGLFRGGKAGMTAKKPLDFTKSAKSGFTNANAATMRNEQRIAAGGSSNPINRLLAPNKLNKMDAEISRNKSKQQLYNDAKSEAKSEALKNGTNYEYYKSNSRANGKTLSQLSMLKDNQNLTQVERDEYTQAYNELEKYAIDFNLDTGRVAENATVSFDADNGGRVTSILNNKTLEAVSVENVGNENSIIKTNIDALMDMYEEDGNDLKDENGNSRKVPVGDGTGKRAKLAKDIRNDAGKKVNETINSKEYRQAKVDAQYSGKK